MSPAPSSLQRPAISINVRAALLLAAITVAGNFWCSSFFGIYEDDYLFTINAYGWNWAECWSNIRSSLVEWPQGRPIGFAMTHLFSWASAQFDTLTAGYAIGAFLLSLNGFLLFRLLRRFMPVLPSLIGAGVYCLYPVDTSKVILMHRAFQLLNFTFLISALILFTSGRRLYSYPVAVLCLLTYEPFFLPFLVAPLLVQNPKTIRWRSVIIHIGACSAIVAIVVIIRSAHGDSRLSQIDGSLLVVASHSAYSLIFGPWMVLRESSHRLIEALLYSDSLQWTLIAASTIAVFLINSPVGDVSDPNSEGTNRTLGDRLRAREFLWLIAIGVLVLSISYLLCFRPDNFPPLTSVGRLSGFNAPGSLGAAIAVGGIFCGLQRFPKTGSIVGGLLLGLLVSFGVEVQRRDYVEHWARQKQLWNQINETSGEWNLGTAIIVNIEGHNGSIATAGFPAYWVINYAPALLPRLYCFPPEYTTRAPDGHSQTPRVFGYCVGLKSASESSGTAILKSPPWFDATLWPRLHDGSFIYFSFVDGHLKRSISPFALDGHTFTPAMPLTAPPKRFGPTRLYHVLFQPPPLWPTFSRARNYPR